MANFLKSLIIVSEKAANIARACRSEKELFELLIEEKKGAEGNEKRFFQDFKTLADVLVQETVRHDLEKEFPSLCGNIRGEESNTFSNTLNKTITVEVKDDHQETVDLLSTVLDGHTRAAELLTNEVYKNVCFESINSNKLDIPDDIELNLDNVGIWIDPIDSTSEYINGYISSSSHTEIHRKGLQCVTVLIGCFNKITGLPIAGVINQPFYNFENNRWQGKCFWGIQTNGQVLTSEEIVTDLTNNIVLSRIEKENVQEKLRENGFNLLKTAGAGYKILTVVCGLVDAYVISLDTIFNWDTCAPHAILQALGGNIIEFESMVINKNKNILKYNENFDTKTKDIQVWKHSLGVIAYRNNDVLEKLINVLSN
ncbi:inositol polyphosphate 1-phosphatase [Chrysoperla carnea]|uniref:inositol polyphosphate 1-phosphatase n=1 Tax=Chrysoperla carnea TaxID=189513 RepID=UPI001D062343|nr:inositol polyphosphate 1-phosphatase [Chrysoperla carnea]